jgi:hypothetical protein
MAMGVRSGRDKWLIQIKKRRKKGKNAGYREETCLSNFFLLDRGAQRESINLNYLQTFIILKSGV